MSGRRIVKTAHNGKRRSNGSGRRTSTRERSDTFFRLLVILSIFALCFFGIRNNWPATTSVEVQGTVVLSEREVVELAALEDYTDLWAISVPVEKIADSLMGHSLIEHAIVEIAGLTSIRIEITERKPIASLEYRECHLTFDQYGALVDIIGNAETCIYPGVRGIPPGLLYFQGERLYETGDAWDVGSGDIPRAEIETQFQRVIHLRYMLDHQSASDVPDPNVITLDGAGNISVKYENTPLIVLGKFHSPGLQFRMMIASLENEFLCDPERVMDIDLSSEKFPCYHVYEDYITPQERRQIEQWREEALLAEADETESDNDTAPSIDETVNVSDPVGYNPDIFDLANSVN